jgi:hypothetical protein
MSIIELGDLTSGSQARAPREFDRRILVRLALVAVAVLTVLGVTASARPRSIVIQTLWTMPFHNGDQYMADSTTVYTKASGPGTRLVARDLANGRARWSRAMPDNLGWPVEIESAHVLLLSDAGATIAVDSRTGADLWRRPGAAQATNEDTALLADLNEDGSVISGMRMVRLRDGGVVWTRPSLGRAQLVAGGPDVLQNDFVVTVRPDGGAEVIRWEDGAQLAAARIDWRPGAGFDGSFSSMDADGRNLYVRLADGRGSSLTAYALDTLAQAWRQEDAARVSAYPCGPVICSLENDNFAAYDIVTGLTRWRAVGVQDAVPVGSGRMLIADGAPDAYVLVDQLTGARIASLGLGTPTWDYSRRTFYLLRHAHSPAGMTAISRVNPVTGAVSLRGAIRTFADFGCDFTADKAICPTTAGRMVISRIG